MASIQDHRVVTLTTREITVQELKELATFEILWPSRIPAQYYLARVLEFTSDLSRSTGTGCFVIEYKNNESHVIHIHQSQNTTPNYEGRRAIASFIRNNDEVALFEDGQLTRSFFKVADINVELVSLGATVNDIAMIAQTLAVE